MTRTIRLDGGPCDGDFVCWEGADIIRIARKPTAPIISSNGYIPTKDEFQDHVYFRSERDPSIFIYRGIE